MQKNNSIIICLITSILSSNVNYAPFVDKELSQSYDAQTTLSPEHEKMFNDLQERFGNDPAYKELEEHEARQKEGFFTRAFHAVTGGKYRATTATPTETAPQPEVPSKETAPRPQEEISASLFTTVKAHVKNTLGIRLTEPERQAIKKNKTTTNNNAVEPRRNDQPAAQPTGRGEPVPAPEPQPAPASASAPEQQEAQVSEPGSPEPEKVTEPSSPVAPESPAPTEPVPAPEPQPAPTEAVAPAPEPQSRQPFDEKNSEPQKATKNVRDSKNEPAKSLSLDQALTLTPEQVKALSPEEVKALTNEIAKSISEMKNLPSNLNQLSQEQRTKIVETHNKLMAQITELTPEQVKALQPDQIQVILQSSYTTSLNIQALTDEQLINALKAGDFSFKPSSGQASSGTQFKLFANGLTIEQTQKIIDDYNKSNSPLKKVFDDSQITTLEQNIKFENYLRLNATKK